MITTLKPIPSWLRIILYVPAAICFIIIYAYAQIKKWYNYEFTNRAFKKLVKKLTTKKQLVADMKARIADFNDLGRRSKYIPKRIKTVEEMHQHLIKFYGDDLKKHKLFLTPSLKIIDKSKPVKK